MTSQMSALLSKLKPGTHVTPAAVTAAIDGIPFSLPRDYVETLSSASGWSGFLSDSSPFVDLWPIDEVMVRNASYNVSPVEDGMLLIGSDGGGTAYAIVQVGGQLSFADVPFVPLKVGEATLRGDSLEEFLENIAKGGHLVGL